MKEVDVYIVKVCIADAEYYMASMSYTISKNLKDAVIFKQKKTPISMRQRLKEYLMIHWGKWKK